jgi:hypothetical protein
MSVALIEPELPRSRVTLATAIARRETTLEKLKAANAAADRLRGLIADEASTKAILADLEKKSAEGALAWARGQSEKLKIAETSELEDAKRKAEKAKRLADAARTAMPEIVADHGAATREMSAATGFVTDAVRQVLIEEVVPALSAERVEHLKRATECEAKLIAIGECFKDAIAGEPAGLGTAKYSALMRDTLFQKVEEARATFEMKQTYRDFAGRLANDAAATLEASR